MVQTLLKSGREINVVEAEMEIVLMNFLRRDEKSHEFNDKIAR